MNYSLFKLCFPSGFHVSSGGFADESAEATIHSDTLMGAIASASAKLCAATETADMLLFSSISSAFPYWGDVLFFPKPLTAEVRTDKPKKFKTTKFVDRNIWQELLLGEQPEFSENNVVNGCWTAQYERESERKKDNGLQSLYRVRELPRVTLDRISQSSQLFNFNEVHFAPDCGLFFLASFGNAEAERTFRASLRLLGDEGIGADRTVGKGWFTLEETALDIEHSNSSGTYMLLSLYSPTEQERSSLDIKRCGYELLTRRGWATAPHAATYRRQALRMFAEGSVLQFTNGSAPTGHNPVVLSSADFQLPHDILRYGKALAIPIINKPSQAL